MAKYLINLVCIIGIAGAAHAGAVANLEITPDGQAYVVFTGDQPGPVTGVGELTGYSIIDLNGQTNADNGDTALPSLSFLPSAGENGTGEYATAGWASLQSQGATVGVELGQNLAPGNEWFVETASLSYVLAELNVQGFFPQVSGAPLYIGKILDNGGTPFVDSDPRLANIQFSATASVSTVPETPGAPVEPTDFIVGSVSVRTVPALTAGITVLDGSEYRKTVGATNTDMDITFVNGSTVVVDLNAANGAAVYADGAVTVDGKVLGIAYADKVAGALRVRANDMASLKSVAVTATLTETTAVTGDLVGSIGTLGGSNLVISQLGDFDLDGVCNATDIDMISAAVGSGDLFTYDLDGDGAITSADRLNVIGNLAMWDNGAGTTGFGTANGDLDLDGDVDDDDYSRWALNYTGPAASGKGWLTGDIDGDGDVDDDDYSFWALNYGLGP
ncbi:MAG: hypothetical protein HN350_16695, partial [Phycisphaerales bacterium]|nr:hypothetical protein [Phycisphaerales bacterium]